MRTLQRLWGVGFLALGMTTAPASAQQAVKDIPGPIDSLQDLEDAGKMLFKAVDENNDNQISQKEAVDAGNLLVGGFFFRADANGDGTLTPEEARAARDAFLSQKPWLKYAVETVKNEKQKQPGQSNSPGDVEATVFATFDTNNDKKLEASEVRQGVQTVVQGIFATADTNRDGQLSPSEVNAAIAGTGKTLAEAAFKGADKDGNGALSEQEFDDAMKRPVHMVFAVADLNHDGQLSQEEAQRIRHVVMSKIQALRVPEPENSPKNLLRTGRQPSEVAPVPAVSIPSPKPGNTQTSPR
ncbi:MAG: EF-hand domain-containing protein [Isosphaeraceae bacterium]|nr:EF-hand domain-containing protein [Isosphaeraceae bacterium]